MPETRTLEELVEKDYDELLRSMVASTYGLIAGQPSATVSFDNTAQTAFHEPSNETTVITEQNVPEALRSQRLLKMVLLRGAAAHEAGHHKTFMLEGDTHSRSKLGGFLSEPLDYLWTSPGTMPEKWMTLVMHIRKAVWMETEDLRANAFIEREYNRLYWDALKLLIRYMRIGWMEFVLAGMDFAVQTAGKDPKDEILCVAGSNGRSLSVSDVSLAGRILRERGLAADPESTVRPVLAAGLVRSSNVWRLIPEIFKVLYVYWPREIDRYRDPIVDILVPLRQYYERVVANFPSDIQCFFPESAEKLLKSIESIRAQAAENIESASTPDRATDAYRIALGRFFGEIVNLGCAKPESEESRAQKKVDEPGRDPGPVPSPEDPGGTPGGGNETRGTGNKQEKKLRDKARADGDDTAEEEERERHGSGAGSLGPVKKIRKWLADNPHASGRGDIEKSLDAYLDARKK